MQKSSGDDLLQTFSNLNIDLRNLSPNVIQAWFDTDCENTKALLNWMCDSLSSVNYVPPLERAEFYDIQEQLDSDKCAEELVKLNPTYLSILDDSKHCTEIVLIEDEIDLLAEENKDLDKLIKIYENIDCKISLDLTHKTQREIESTVGIKNSQESCESLCAHLDEFNKKLQKMLIKYDPDSHIVNFINVKEYQENVDNLNSCLTPLMEISKTIIENSDDFFSEELQTCRNRFLHSYQIYLTNKVEMEKLKEILEFLNTTNANESTLSWNSFSNLGCKDLYKKHMCDVLDSIVSKLADHYLKRTRIRYVEQELEELQLKSQNVSKMLGIVTKCLSYYAITNCLQLEEKKDVECINDFYQKMVRYVNEDLHRCHARTVQMKSIIEDYNLYLTKPIYERSKLLASIVKVLSSDSCTLKAAADAVGKFKTELSLMESQIFSIDFETEQEKAREINESIRILQDFLMSGPTNKVVLVPLDLQEAWFEIEEHLKKESASVGQAVQIPQSVRKAMTKAQNYKKQLWMNFLTTPSKLVTTLKQAEDDFKKRTQEYF